MGRRWLEWIGQLRLLVRFRKMHRPKAMEYMYEEGLRTTLRELQAGRDGDISI
jgi:hypothetical protein